MTGGPAIAELATHQPLQRWTDEGKGESSGSDHQAEDEYKLKWSFSLGGDPEQGPGQV